MINITKVYMPQIARYAAIAIPEEVLAQPIAGIISSPASENQKRPKAENAVPAKTSPFF